MRALLMIAALAVAVPDRQDPTPKTDQSREKQILGEWAAVKGSKTLQFKASETLFSYNGIPSPSDGLTAKISIDWSKNPVTIDFMPMRGGTMPGILNLDGDRLTIALRVSGGTRPTDFGVNPQVLLLNYNRVRR